MKVLRNGKEVKGAKIFYNNQSGAPLYVEDAGVNYDASAFTFEGERDNVVTKGEVLSSESITEVKETDTEEVEEETLNVTNSEDKPAEKKKTGLFGRKK